MRSAWMLAATVGIAACVGPEPTLPTNCTMCGDQCVDFQVDPNHCGGCDTVCGAGLVCSAGTCAVNTAWPSVISPGTESLGVPVAYPSLPQGAMFFTIATPFPSKIYYRRDGQPPRKGEAGTLNADSPLSLPTSAPESQTPLDVRWYAEYTLPDGTPLAEQPQRYVHILDESLQQGAGHRLYRGVRFTGPGGGTIVVHPNAEVSGEYSTQIWRGSSGSAIAIQSLWLEQTQIACGGDGKQPYPGVGLTIPFTFQAPAARGRYRVLSQIGLDYSCSSSQLNGGAQVVGEVIVL